MVDDDLGVRRFGPAPRRETLRQLAPRGNQLLATATALGLTLTTTVGVIDRVHRHTADRRADTEPTGAAGLAEGLLIVVAIADLADRGAALGVDVAQLARRHLERRLTVLDRHQLKAGPGAAGDLRAASRHELDAVQAGRRRDDRQREVVPHGVVVGRGLIGGHDRVAHLQALGGEDVGLDAVGVRDQGEIRRPVRIVLEGLHAGREVEPAALEVHNAVQLLVATAAVAGGDAAVNVAATSLVLGLGEATLGALAGELARGLVQGREAAGGRQRTKGMNGHGGISGGGRGLRPIRSCRRP